MKKTVSLILTVCFIFLASNVMWSTDIRQDRNAGSVINLNTASELSAKLESVNVDVSDAAAYEVSVLIGLYDFASEMGLNFEVKNISTDTKDIDLDLESHRNKVKEYYMMGALEFYYGEKE